MGVKFMKNSLADINGIKIRRQYFNLIIYIYLVLLVSLTILFATCEIASNRFTFSEYFKSVTIAFKIVLGVILPFVILSVFNRFTFGKIICVLNAEGIHYKDGCIKWDNITEMKYNITSFSRVHYAPAFITIICKNDVINIVSAPLLMFYYAKRFKSDIKFKKDNSVCFIIGIIVIIAVFLPFIVIR